MGIEPNSIPISFRFPFSLHHQDKPKTLLRNVTKKFKTQKPKGLLFGLNEQMRTSMRRFTPDKNRSIAPETEYETKQPLIYNVWNIQEFDWP